MTATKTATTLPQAQTRSPGTQQRTGPEAAAPPSSSADRARLALVRFRSSVPRARRTPLERCPRRASRAPGRFGFSFGGRVGELRAPPPALRLRSRAELPGPALDLDPAAPRARRERAEQMPPDVGRRPPHPLSPNGRPRSEPPQPPGARPGWTPRAELDPGAGRAGWVRRHRARGAAELPTKALPSAGAQSDVLGGEPPLRPSVRCPPVRRIAAGRCDGSARAAAPARVRSGISGQKTQLPAPARGGSSRRDHRTPPRHSPRCAEWAAPPAPLPLTSAAPARRKKIKRKRKEPRPGARNTRGRLDLAQSPRRRGAAGQPTNQTPLQGGPARRPPPRLTGPGQVLGPQGVGKTKDASLELEASSGPPRVQPGRSGAAPLPSQPDRILQSLRRHPTAPGLTGRLHRRGVAHVLSPREVRFLEIANNSFQIMHFKYKPTHPEATTPISSFIEYSGPGLTACITQDQRAKDQGPPPAEQGGLRGPRSAGAFPCAPHPEISGTAHRVRDPGNRTRDATSRPQTPRLPPRPDPTAALRPDPRPHCCPPARTPRLPLAWTPDPTAGPSPGPRTPRLPPRPDPRPHGCRSPGPRTLRLPLARTPDPTAAPSPGPHGCPSPGPRTPRLPPRPDPTAAACPDPGPYDCRSPGPQTPRLPLARTPRLPLARTPDPTAAARPDPRPHGCPLARTPRLPLARTPDPTAAPRQARSGPFLPDRDLPLAREGMRLFAESRAPGCSGARPEAALSAD
ncbi:basic proline-rich protein-like [Sciurus carolinensis]|uniref:basic proline-rich protein-like n=1 Tax=Sciurus carolinensis TaxID=30640 RepID=UPI001FB558C7|nr:basic proline-rich protein-like [Sciurus carolinensis]